VAKERVMKFAGKYPITLVDQRLIHFLAELETMEEKALAEGHEGIMVRRPSGLYKHGRATEKSQDLLKIKRFADDEAIVIGVTELMHNDNAAFTMKLAIQHGAAHRTDWLARARSGHFFCETKMVWSSPWDRVSMPLNGRHFGGTGKHCWDGS